MKAYFTKTFYGLAPADESSRQWFEKLKAGETVKVEVNRVRNYRFLKKYFALLNIAFENWEPGEVSSKYGKPEKNFDRFRADITILSGYFDTTVRLDGSVRIEPKSISFTQMSEEEFEQLYSKTIDLLVKHV
jgi:hypothetical protein